MRPALIFILFLSYLFGAGANVCAAGPAVKTGLSQKQQQLLVHANSNSSNRLHLNNQHAPNEVVAFDLNVADDNDEEDVYKKPAIQVCCAIAFFHTFFQLSQGSNPAHQLFDRTLPGAENAPLYLLQRALRI